MSRLERKKDVSIEQILAALLDDSRVFPPSYLHQLSDLEGVDLQAFSTVWPQVNPERRKALLEDLEELAEADTLVSFENVARLALLDSDPRVRTLAIRLLWESEDTALVPEFTRMLEHDEDVNVRSAAATALGLFIYLGELEEIPEHIARRLENLLLGVLRGKDDKLVRRRALESMGYSGRKEVPALIRDAFESDDPEWLVSSLFAMGRSADTSWRREILSMLRHHINEVRLEAVRAAGELELEAARMPLLRMLEEEHLDESVRLATIWSLSKIGGEDVRETLESLLDEADDDEEVEFIENALDNLAFTEDKSIFEMFDFEGLDSDDESDEEDYLLDDEEYDDDEDEDGNRTA